LVGYRGLQTVRGKRIEIDWRRRLGGAIQALIDDGVTKFGMDRALDASEAWETPSDDIKKIREAQVSGVAGRRNF
jgi:hypothetical protein